VTEKLFSAEYVCVTVRKSFSNIYYAKLSPPPLGIKSTTFSDLWNKIVVDSFLSPKMKDNKRRKNLNAKSYGEEAWLIKLLTPRKENLKACHELTETYVRQI